MPPPREVQIKFWVRYKPAPHYNGHFHQGMKPGIHGKFDTIVEAEAAAVKCRNWFNKENVAEEIARGKFDIKTTHHDNVVVWITEYHDGELYQAPTPVVEDSPLAETTSKKGNKSA